VKAEEQWARGPFPTSWNRADKSYRTYIGFGDLNFMPRDNVVLQCTECKSRNYVTTKNKKTTTERLEFKKFCRRCRKHINHKETK
jgi:large subunit ribosomal protein L33